MPVTIELTDNQVDTIAHAVAKLLTGGDTMTESTKFVPLSKLMQRTGKSREWFVGRANPYREGALNHYRTELEGTLVQYPDSPRGRYHVNLARMVAWVDKHGAEEF